MNGRGITIRQSRIFLISSIILFIAAETIAEIADLWLVNNPSVENLLTYNRWLSAIPGGLSTGASVFLMFGLLYYPKRSLMAIIFVGAVMLALSFALTSIGIFSQTIEYYPGYHWTINSGPLSNLFSIGTGAIIAPIISFLFRDTLTEQASVAG